MINKLLVFIGVFCFIPFSAFADDSSITVESISAPEQFICSDLSGISLMSETPSMDFSFLDGVFCVEVSNIPSSASLFIAGYSNSGTLTDSFVINDIMPRNTVPISGDYARAYLWDTSTMTPLCKSITTFTDYEIIEGREGDWEVSEDGHTIYNYLGTDTDVVIPNSYMGKRIYYVQNEPDINAWKYNSINETYHYNIFNDRTDITSLQISDGIMMIGSYAFAMCSEISSSVSLPSSILIIGPYAYYGCSSMYGDLDLSNLKILYPFTFYKCSNLNGTLTLPAVSDIPQAIFADCNNLKGSLTIPEGVENIGIMAFAVSASSNSFTSLSLPSTLKSISPGAFQYQTHISSAITLPEGLEHIGDFAFNHCTRISNTSLKLPSSLKTIGGDYNVEVNTGWGGHVFYDSFKNLTEFSASGNFTAKDGILYSSDMTRLIAYPPSKPGTEFIVPEGVTQFDEMSFAHSKITDLTLPDSYIVSETVPANIINQTANNLAVAFYHNNSIQNIWTKDSNPAYVSYDGVLYSKDMSQLWYVPSKKTGTIYVSTKTSEIMKGAFYIEYLSGGETYTGVHIPASVTKINPYSLASINLRPLKDITVDENNLYYTISNSKLVKRG